MSSLPALCQDRQVLDAVLVVKNHSGMVQLLLGILENKKNNKIVWDILQECKKHSMCTLARSQQSYGPDPSYEKP